jgi:uncharacterized damage-inducible protein DinB
MSLAPDAPDIARLIEENLQGLSQLTQLLALLSAEQYQCCFGLKGQHTVGKHVRHIIDHYQAFLLGLDEMAVPKVNYEHRQREKALETQPGTAGHRLRLVGECLGQLLDDHHQAPILLDYPTGKGSVEMPSCLGRELAFLSSHTIHHMAIIGLLAEQLNVEPDRTFGVHPSTLRYRDRERNKGVDSDRNREGQTEGPHFSETA